MRQKYFLSKLGLTLTELIVATVLIGLVMLGIIAFDVTLRRAQNTTQRSLFTNTRALTIVAEIMNEALKAEGNITDPGVFIDKVNTPAKWIAFKSGEGATKKIVGFLYLAGIYTVCRVEPFDPNNPSTACSSSGILSKSVIAASFSYENCVVSASVTLKYDPTKTESVLTNPKFQYSSAVQPSISCQ